MGGGSTVQCKPGCKVFSFGVSWYILILFIGKLSWQEEFQTAQLESVMRIGFIFTEVGPEYLQIEMQTVLTKSLRPGFAINPEHRALSLNCRGERWSKVSYHGQNNRESVRKDRPWRYLSLPSLKLENDSNIEMSSEDWCRLQPALLTPLSKNSASSSAPEKQFFPTV